MTTNEIERPVIIVDKIGDQGTVRFVINIAEMMDPEKMHVPVIPGILMSDLPDHIAHAYHEVTDRDERDIRADILKAMRNEDRFKEKDPARSGMKGGLV